MLCADNAVFFVLRANPNLPDKDGSTPVHIAASMGHTATLRHLVEKGGNIWALDNQGQTPAMAAATRRRAECFKYLDSLSVRLQVETSGAVQKMQQRAIKEAEKRMKQLRKKQIEQNKHTAAPTKTGEGKTMGKKSKTYAKLPTAGQVSDVAQQLPVKPSTVSGFRQRILSSPMIANPGQLKLNTMYRQVALGNFVLKPAETPKKEDDPKGMLSFKSFDTLDNEQADNAKESVGHHHLRRVGSTGSIRISPNLGEEDKKQTAATIRGIFRNEVSATAGLVNTLSSLKTPQPADMAVSANNSSYSTTSERQGRRSRTTSLSDAAQNNEESVKANDDEPLDDTDAAAAVAPEIEVDNPLAALLAALELESILDLLEKERMDLDALALCSDSDLKEINIPLGPRRKIMAAIRRRNDAMQTARHMKDTPI